MTALRFDRSRNELKSQLIALRFAQLLVEHAGRGGIAAALVESGYFQHAHGAIERDRDHVADLDRMARRLPARATAICRVAAARSWDHSLRPDSCSFSAASFAKGEFGSAGRSRSRGFAL